LKITFLGTGACVANLKRGLPSLLVETWAIGIRVSELEYLFITHPHPDHTTDYPAIVHDQALTTRKRLNAYGPKGLSLHTHILFTQLYPEVSQSPRYFEIRNTRGKFTTKIK